MFILLVKMALYIVASVMFGVLVGYLYAKAKNEELMVEKEQKYNKTVSDKNAMIMHLKGELRAAQRKVDTINQGYELQSKLLATKEKEFTEGINQQIVKKDKIIRLLEKKIQQISSSQTTAA